MTKPSNGSALSSLLANSIRNGSPLIGAFLFWFFVIVLVVLAAAEKKNEPLNALASVAGAAGQIFFAYMVYRLGKEQFAFSKQVSERQARIDFYEPRQNVYQTWASWRKTAFSDISHDNILKAYSIAEHIDLSFDAETATAANQMLEVYEGFAQAVEEMQAIDDDAAEAAFNQVSANYHQQRALLRQALADVSVLMRHAIRVERT